MKVAVALVLLAVACGDAGVASSPASSTAGSAASGVWAPEPGTTWQWQLTGAVDTSHDVEMYDIDLFETPQAVIDELHAAGRVVVCYFSAGTHEEGRPDSDAFPAEVIGDPLDDWPDERWLDVRAIDALAPIMEARLDLAAEKGCDGVEPDNVDAYDNPSGFAITAVDQLAYARWLADQAHARRLSVGLKDNLGQVADLVGVYDWALNEECFEFDECELLAPFVDAGKAVFGVEYGGDPAEYCPEAVAAGYSWLTKTYDLGPEPVGACE